MTAENLTRGFFQSFCSREVTENSKPTLQVLETRAVGTATSGGSRIRIRLSDGMFSYSHCVGGEDLLNRFQNEDLFNDHPIIQVTEFTLPSNDLTLVVADAVLQKHIDEAIGEPVPHSGDASSYRGISVDSQANGAPSPSRKRVLENIDAAGIPSKKPAGSGHPIQPSFDIGMVTPYVSKFRLRGIVTSKEDIRNVNTRRGPSNVFGFVLTDEQGNSIKITGFGAECDRFHSKLAVNEPIYLSCQGPVVKEANQRFNSTGHAYEITLNAQCDIEPCLEAVSKPVMRLSAVKLSDIKNYAGRFVDVIAVVDKIEDTSTVVARNTNKTLTKRNVYLVDDSEVLVQLVLWEDEARNFSDEHLHQVIGLKGVSVREFNGGFSLSVSGTTQTYYNPEGERTEALYQWFNDARPNTQLGSLSAAEGPGAFEKNFRLIGVVTASDMTRAADDRGMYVTVKAMINTMKSENVFYTACGMENCRKKATPEDGRFRCDRCGIQDTSKHLYNLNLEIADFSGTSWMVFFDETASVLLGKSAGDLANLKDMDPEEYEAVFDKVRFQWFEFRCRVKYETFNDSQTLRWTCLSVAPVNYDRYNRLLKSSAEKLDSL